MPNWLNPNWLLSRLLEKMGVGDYTARCEFAAHLFAGATFALLGMWTAIGWSVFVLIDEFVFDGFKGRDTYIDLASKLAGPIGYAIWAMT
jgi:hypothetical protein